MGNAIGVSCFFYTSRLLKSMLDELSLATENISIETGIRTDNASVVERAHSINSDTADRRRNDFLESNMGKWRRILG